MIKKIFDFLNSITLKDIIYFIIIGTLVWVIFNLNSKNNELTDRYENNIEAYTDSISYYKTKTGDLIAEKTMFECDIDELKKLNENLYNEISDLKIKNKTLNALYVEAQINHPGKDTLYIIDTVSISQGFYKEFNFNDKWRSLEGYISYVPDSLRFNITKDITNLDYTFAVDKDNKVYLKTSNPYVSYNEFTGFTIPKEKKKRFVFGPSVTYGWSLIEGKPDLIIGISGTYKFFEF